MKIRNGKYHGILLICSLAIIITGCASKSQNSTNLSFTNTTKLSASNNQQSMGDYTISRQLFSDESHHNSKIQIFFPQIEHANKDLSALNASIKETASEFANRYYGSDYEDLTLDLDYRIADIGNKFVSIIFEGLGNVKTAAHPNHIFFTRNLAIPDAKPIHLSDVFQVNDAFLSIYKKYFYEQTDKEKASILKNYTDKELLEMLQQCDTDISSCSSYYKKGIVGISLPVIFALGDHIETEIPQDALLSNRKKDSILSAN